MLAEKKEIRFANLSLVLFKSKLFHVLFYKHGKIIMTA